MNVWRLPSGYSQSEILAFTLLEKNKEQPFSLADTIIFLPTQRACRTMQDAFLRQSAGTPLLLPQLIAVNEIDSTLNVFSNRKNLLPAITASRRHILLTQMIQRFRPDWPTPLAMSMARELGRLIDEIHLQEIDTDKISQLAQTQELAQHWQITLNFLQPIFTLWPSLLQNEGCLDVAERRVLALKACASEWETSQPKNTIIAAGLQANFPALKNFLKSLLSLENGHVLLSGLPPLAEAQLWWNDIDESHPFYETKELINGLDITPQTIKDWPVTPAFSGDKKDDEKQNRRMLLQCAMLPSKRTDQWTSQAKATDPNLSFFECETEQEEAMTVALALRHTLQTENKTALFVTPNRLLARRVAEIMRRWNITINDSAGLPLAQTATAHFLYLLITLARSNNENFSIALLSVLKHPLFALHRSTAQCRTFARLLDATLLRDKSGKISLNTLITELNNYSGWTSTSKETITDLNVFIGDLCKKIFPLSDLLQQEKVDLNIFFPQFFNIAEDLCSNDLKAGHERLWQGDAGKCLAQWVSELLAALTNFPRVSSNDVLQVLRELMHTCTVRPRYNDHPRLTILGPIEARLQTADRIILGGLNEGIWPARLPADPWMSRPMREEAGLISSARMLSEQAHDFYMLCSGAEVILTRSQKSEGTPHVASRWWQRLNVVITPSTLPSEHNYLSLARAIDFPLSIDRCPSPSPTPPIAYRPKKLFVTDIEKLQTNPYAIYARYILRLKALNPLCPQIGPAERGLFIHTTLEHFIKQYPDQLPKNALDVFLKTAETALNNLGLNAYKNFWWPRIIRIAEWFIEEQTSRHALAKNIAVECAGRITLTPNFTLIGRMDRVDRLADGSLELIDYKTTSLPLVRDRESLIKGQLALEAAMVLHHGFYALASENVRVSKLSYWVLSSDAKASRTEPFSRKNSAEEWAARAIDHLLLLVKKYEDESTPYLCEPLGPVKYNDYQHLSRIKEWSILPFEENDDNEDLPGADT